MALDDAHSGANSRAVTLDVGATTNTVLTRRTPVEEMGPINASANSTAALTPYTKTEKPAAAASSGSRLDCLDTFRGMCLTFMIFVNYGGGGYWFFDHASWNGLTFADLLFPWFMWVMGVSMALSLKRLHSDEYRGTILDPFCKYPAGLNSAHKHYTVHVLEAGSSKGWSQIDSAPSTPHRSSHASSNNSSEQHAASLEQAATVANTTANTAALMAPPALTPMPTPSRPQPTTGQAAAKVTIPQPSWPLWRRVLRRACILYALGCFLNNGYNVAVTGHFRVLGVLQYFGISTLVVGATILGLRQRTAALLAAFERQQIQLNEKLGPATGRAPPAVVQAGAEFLDTFGVAALPPTEPFSYKNVYHWLRLLDIRQSVMWCYKWEYLVMTFIFSFYLIICLGVAAPGCPVGYNGPGGRASGGEYAQCTGGIHRYIDMSIVGWNHFYHKPTCIDLYDCEAYDPEGLLGSLTACTLTYLGIVTGRILMHYPTHAARLSRWWVLGGALCLLAALLCGFSQNDGAIPVNKNLWSASFGLLMGGGGMIALSGVYFLVDQRGWWTGAPFRYLGLNSILLYVGHELLQGYFPFEWAQEFPTHMSLITMNIIGVTLWALIARYCYAIKFFVKI